MRSTFAVSPATLVRSSGGVLPLTDLAQSGSVRPAVDADLAAGRLMRVRRGWYATPDAPADVVRAARVGGALTAASAARMHQLWLLDDPLLHVRVPATAARLRSPSDASAALNREVHGVCVHYRTVEPTLFEGDLPARDGLARSLAEMFRCAGIVPAMVALESALNRGVLPMQGLETIRGLVPAWARRQLDLASPDSDSGLETITRMLFVRRHVRVRTQVLLAGVRRVDLLVGDRLVIELDGRAFHSGEDFERDRIQDLELALRGYLVVRLSYRMVTSDWDSTHRAVHELVARGLHRWGRPAREGEAFRAGDAGDWALSSL
jgi:very-short-patch-repair endonuclease